MNYVVVNGLNLRMLGMNNFFFWFLGIRLRLNTGGGGFILLQFMLSFMH